MLYLFLGLKIPLLLLYALVYWAIKQEPEAEDAGRDGGARKERPHPVPPLPPARRPGAAAAAAGAPAHRAGARDRASVGVEPDQLAAERRQLGLPVGAPLLDVRLARLAPGAAREHRHVLHDARRVRQVLA